VSASRHWILGPDNEPLQIASLVAWAEWFEKTTVSERAVARWESRGVTVSTTFLALDHDYTGRGPPILFETMIFVKGEYVSKHAYGMSHMYQQRYATRLDAQEGHARAVCLARVLLGDFGTEAQAACEACDLLNGDATAFAMHVAGRVQQ
jgi:hypothetical protein